MNNTLHLSDTSWIELDEHTYAEDESYEDLEVKPIKEIFICFGQEEFFDGDPQQRACDFEILDLFVDEELSESGHRHLQAVLEKRRLQRVVSHRQGANSLRPNQAIKEPHKKSPTEGNAIQQVPSLQELSMEIMDGVA